MTKTTKSFGLAAISLTSLLLASPSLGAEVRKEEGTLPSQYPYYIAVPANWNGIVINNLDAVADKDTPFASYLLEHGYAYTGTGRHPERMTRHDPLTELEAQVAAMKARFGDGVIPRPPFWGGYRVVAEVVELWHADEFRLHDRIVYTRGGTGWTVATLQP